MWVNIQYHLSIAGKHNLPSTPWHLITLLNHQYNKYFIYTYMYAVMVINDNKLNTMLHRYSYHSIYRVYHIWFNCRLFGLSPFFVIDASPFRWYVCRRSGVSPFWPATHLIPRCVRPGDPGIHNQSINQLWHKRKIECQCPMRGTIYSRYNLIRYMYMYMKKNNV